MYRIINRISVSEMKRPRNGYLGIGSYGVWILYIEDADYVMGLLGFLVIVIEPVDSRAFVQF